MSEEEAIYRGLQRHLDRQAVGFPAARRGADLVLLRRLFAPHEARLALQLSYKPQTTASIVERGGSMSTPEEVQAGLESMFKKGAIGRRERGGDAEWYLLPLVIGMYEGQDGEPSPGFLRDAGAYMGTLAYGRSLLAVRPPQMRTVPVNKSLSVEHHEAAEARRAAITGRTSIHPGIRPLLPHSHPQQYLEHHGPLSRAGPPVLPDLIV